MRYRHDVRRRCETPFGRATAAASSRGHAGNRQSAFFMRLQAHATWKAELLRSSKSRIAMPPIGKVRRGRGHDLIAVTRLAEFSQTKSGASRALADGPRQVRAWLCCWRTSADGHAIRLRSLARRAATTPALGGLRDGVIGGLSRPT